MTVRELIEGLLDFPMEATVRLNINEEHVDERGEKCLGYMFDIDKMESWGVSCLLTFTDWRNRL